MVTLLAAAAQAFDVDSATRAYLDTSQGAARARSDAYFEGGYWLILFGASVSTLVYWLMLHTGWSAAWSERSRRITASPLAPTEIARFDCRFPTAPAV